MKLKNALIIAVALTVAAASAFTLFLIIRRDAELISASSDGDADGVKLFLALGADVNAKENTHGVTALMLASGEGHADVVKALLDKGADVGARLENGKTALWGASDGSFLLPGP